MTCTDGTVINLFKGTLYASAVSLALQLTISGFANSVFTEIDWNFSAGSSVPMSINSYRRKAFQIFTGKVSMEQTAT